WVHVQLHQQKGMISLSPPTICNSAVSNEGWCFGTWHATAMYLSISTHSKVPGKNARYAKRANCLHVELSN
ncbi:hypothetical protein ACK6WS_24340, partial [Escherichia coli]